MFVSAAQAGAMLRGGAVGVVPTESVYGLIALATDVAAIERVYDVKHRPSTKPCIVLIAATSVARAMSP
ncbi:MAG TPA: Sua5/YciO/YrdC/YwlC family protein [Candidatus Saccharibacteria bacterium]|nr:Sua5/YciO/YrdC/YwlC family protein [Candidatus Saccharibacteria bacterium]